MEKIVINHKVSRKVTLEASRQTLISNLEKPRGSVKREIRKDGEGEVINNLMSHKVAKNGGQALQYSIDNQRPPPKEAAAQ